MQDYAPPKKYSLTLNGHRTSVSLEPDFWDMFCAIAKAEGKAQNQLASEIDAARAGKSGLAGAIRVYVLDYLVTHPAFLTSRKSPPLP
ncbi:MAG: ribbon-helix-helix domain-containing protein [Pseudomonadota bacterium]